MKITFLGTGAAEGVPAMFCSCAFCNWVRSAGQREVRTRTQILVDSDLLIDFPPEAYYHSFAMGVNLSAVKTLLVTHSHMDHFYAHDFILRGYKYARLENQTLDIFGDDEVGAVFSECTRREMKAEVAPHVRFHGVKPFTVFCAGAYRVIAVPAVHTKEEEALLYYVERDGKGYLHLHDTGNVTDEAVSFLAKNGAVADAVAYDCTFGDSDAHLSARHMGICDVIKIRRKLEEAGVVREGASHILTHFSHNCSPSRENMDKLASDGGFAAAYDGMTLEI